VWASAPEHDLGLVNVKAATRGRFQARRFTDGTVDVIDRSTGAAHEVVVVVAHAQLVTGRAARGLDPADDARVGANP
jgi:hypothetical protein